MDLVRLICVNRVRLWRERIKVRRGTYAADCSATLLEHNDWRADRNTIVQILDVGVEHPDASVRYRPSNRRRPVRAVNSVERVFARAIEIKGSCAEWVGRPARHAARVPRIFARLAPDHILGRAPAWPPCLSAYDSVPAKREACPANTHAIAPRCSRFFNQIQKPIARIDYDCARFVATKTDPARLQFAA